MTNMFSKAMTASQPHHFLCYHIRIALICKHFMCFQRKDLLEKWQILGLSFMMMSETTEDFHDLVKQEFGYIWDGKGWMKEVSYQ